MCSESMITTQELRWTRGLFVGKNETTDEFLLLTSHGALNRGVLKTLLGRESWDKAFLIICVCEPLHPNNSISGSAGGEFVSARPRDGAPCDHEERTSSDTSLKDMAQPLVAQVVI